MFCFRIDHFTNFSTNLFVVFSLAQHCPVKSQYIFSSKWGPSTNIYLLSQIWKFWELEWACCCYELESFGPLEFISISISCKKGACMYAKLRCQKNIRQGSFYFNLAPISNLSINTIILPMIDYSVTMAQVFCNICKYFFYHMGVQSKIWHWRLQGF